MYLSHRKKLVLAGVLAMCLFWLFTQYSICYITSDSMNPGLSRGQWFMGRRAAGFLPGEVVVFHLHGEENVKRVAGVGGDSLEMKEGVLSRNGKTLESMVAIKQQWRMAMESLNGNYWVQYSRMAPHNTWKITIPKGKIFVMGDNRDFSTDSRNYGCIDEKTVWGKFACKEQPAPPSEK